MEFSVDKTKTTPVYRQLIEEITRRIKSGELRPGEQLPAERELANQLQIARGTVKRAYERLTENHILEAGHGRGTFVSNQQNVMTKGRKEQAVLLLRRLIIDMTELKFSYDEIRSLFTVILEDSRQQHENFQIAAVDCNSESLTTFEQQLSHILHLKIHKYPLELFEGNPKSIKQLDAYDLILTTATHYQELLDLDPKLEGRLQQVILSTGQQTIIDLANLGRQESIGVFTSSRNFQNIIREKLRDFNFEVPLNNCLLDCKRNELAEFLQDKTVLFVPPDFEAANRDETEILRQFNNKGGRIIPFEYQIERGALLFIEKTISELMEQSR